MATRKKTAPVDPEITEDTNVMTEETATASKKKGPKPNPFTRLERAKQKAQRAREAYAKVENLARAKEEAEAEEQAALQALQEAVASAGVTTEA